jgi:hypothetical protein
MQSTNALSLSPDVKDWLANSRHPRILHIFDQACNLINEHREVLSIVTPQIGNGPFNLVLENDLCFSDQLNIESQVSISPIHIIIGSLTVYTTDAKLWSPRPDWEKLHARKDDIANQLTQLRVRNYQLCGLGTPFAANAQGYSTTDSHSELLPLNHQSPVSNSLTSNLSSAIAMADIFSCHTTAKQLAGLGIGLTPSGDDFIMGALYAAWIIHPFEIASILAHEVAAIAAPLTTSLSAAWIRSAGRGEVGILWHQFFDALISNVQTQIEKSVENILAVGETSGADALAGFIGVFVSWMEATGS